LAAAASTASRVKWPKKRSLPPSGYEKTDWRAGGNGGRKAHQLEAERLLEEPREEFNPDEKLTRGKKPKNVPAKMSVMPWRCRYFQRVKPDRREQTAGRP